MIEDVMRHVWSEVLGISANEINDDSSFLALGGDSLRTLLVLDKLRHYGFSMDLADLFDAASVAAASAACRESAVAALEDQHAEASHCLQQSPLYHSLIAKPETEAVYYPSMIQLTYVKSPAPSPFETAMYPLRGVNLEKLKTAFEIVFKARRELRIMLQADETTVLTVVRQAPLPWSEESIPNVCNFRVHPPSLLNTLFFQVTVLNGEFLAISQHHVSMDYWSRRFLLQDVARVYFEQELILRPPYELYVRHTRQRPSPERIKFWESYLMDIPNSRLYPDAMGEHTSLLYTEPIDLGNTQKGFGVTKASIIYAAWAVILSRELEQDEVCFSIMVSGRHAPVADIQHMYGPTYHSQPLKVSLAPTMSLRDLSVSIHQSILQILRNSSGPLDMAQQRQIGRQTNTCVNFRPLIRTADDEISHKLFQKPICIPSEMRSTQISVTEREDGLAVKLDARTDEESSEAILQDYLELLSVFTTQPDRKVGDVRDELGKDETSVQVDEDTSIAQTRMGMLSGTRGKIILFVGVVCLLFDILRYTSWIPKSGSSPVWLEAGVRWN
jgi:aryl carrier-like protein